MSEENMQEIIKSLNEEISNFQDIAAEIKPLPGEVPSIPGIDIYGETIPYRGKIGGDHIIYIDFNRRFDLTARISEARERGESEIAGHLEDARKKAGVLLADVSGHRITDAMLAGMLHQSFLIGVLYELKYKGFITTDLFEMINTRFYNSSSVNKFITMIYGEISSTGAFRFLSAAHPPPIIFSNEYDKVVEIDKEFFTTFPPIGTMPSIENPDIEKQDTVLGYKERYRINEIDLMGKGDIMLLYTDGLSEHENREGVMYIDKHLEEKLRKYKEKSAFEIYTVLKDDLMSFARQNDDLSLVIIKKTE